MYDIIFCSIPYSDLDQIYSAPAILKGIATSNNYKAKTVDFGITLLQLCNRDINLFSRIQNYFISPKNSLSPDEVKILDQFYKEILDFFTANPTKYIGISVFSIYTHKSAFEITKLLKDNIDSKIIIGGRGVKIPAYSVVRSDLGLSNLEKTLNYGNFLKKRKLVDHIVIGDGEDAILQFLQGNTNIPEDNRTETFDYPLPNYDDYKFDLYLHGDYEEKIAFPIIGSKGCIRDCDFCDIKFQFGKYRYRTGKDIANEMIYIAEKFNFKKFQFTDSLVNGSLKHLEEFCIVIADYNLNNPDKRIYWTGQYICRAEIQMPKRLYKLMADSGATGLTIGAESGSDHVLEMINKKTTVEALYSELEQFRQHNITCMLLTFVGHWSETFEDFVEHCKMFVNIVPYVRTGTISGVTLGILAAILDGTPGMRDVEKYKIHLDDTIGNMLWVSELNASNTFKERVYRRIVVSKLVQKLKIPCQSEYIRFLELSSLIELEHERINKFHERFNEKTF